MVFSEILKGHFTVVGEVLVRAVHVSEQVVEFKTSLFKCLKARLNIRVA